MGILLASFGFGVIVGFAACSEVIDIIFTFKDRIEKNIRETMPLKFDDEQ